MQRRTSMNVGGMTPALAATSLLLAATWGCQPEFDDRSSQIRDLRVLAVRSEPAEGAPKRDPEPPTVIQYTSLVVDSTGTQTQAPIDWAYCTLPKPVSELNDVNTACFTAVASDFLTPFPQAGTTVSADLPGNACNQFGPDLPNSNPPGRPADPDATGGYYQPVRLLLNRGASFDFAFAETRILCNLPGATFEVLNDYAHRYRANENPVIDSVVALAPSVPTDITLQPEASGPSGLIVAAGQTVRLSASWTVCPTEPACGNGYCEAGEGLGSTDQCPQDCEKPRGCTGSEAFVYFDLTSRQLVDRREAMRVSWYSNFGSFADDRTGLSEEESAAGKSSTENAWTAPSDAREVTLWAVLRDSRGGINWTSYRVTVQ